MEVPAPASERAAAPASERAAAPAPERTNGLKLGRRSSSRWMEVKKALAATQAVVGEGGEELPGGEDGQPWFVHTDSSGQHAITWNQDLVFNGRVLKPGSANLYRFPAVRFADEAFEDVVSAGEGLIPLTELVLQTLEHTEFFTNADGAGANPIHALIVANNDAALDLVFEIFERRPSLMTAVHAPGPFGGESSLHIMIVNLRFKEALKLVQKASVVLEDDGLQQLLLSPAQGGFFTGEPMRSFGGTPLGYACHYGAKDLVSFMMSDLRVREIVDLNRDPCPISGYLPIHATISSGRYASASLCPPLLPCAPRFRAPPTRLRAALPHSFGGSPKITWAIRAVRTLRWAGSTLCAS